MREQTPAPQNPPSASLREFQGALEGVDRRSWWLEAIMVAVILLLTAAIASFALPALFLRPDHDYEFQVGIAVRALVGMVLVFSTYAIYQQILNRRLRRQLANQIDVMTQLQVRAEEFQQLAMLDPLTGLNNRRVAEEHLTAEISRSGRHDYDLTLLALDLDGLKEVNDAYGHAAGDLMLRVFANRLKKAIRSSDLAARMGGDEFLVILPECHPELVPRVLARLSGAEVEYAGKKVPIVFSAGWVGYQPGEHADQLVARADQALYANKRTGQVEEQIQRAQAEMQQAQKMQTVGQLAGSVAHDFNNLLMLVKGYSELVLDQLAPDSPLRKPMEEIQKASERANTLTRQLLSFARNRAVELKVLDLNEAVRDMESMLRRLLGSEVELVLAPGELRGRVRADLGQLEQVLLNLGVNARDAMPQGGRVSIQTADVELDAEYARTHRGARPGPYVMLAVSDTGTGIDDDTKAHIFEPFFTTKKEKGTGLGLATVYGIVKQSGGYIWVDSQPGRGTTFLIYLPRVEEVGAAEEAEAAAAGSAAGAETVLLVDDEAALRGLACDFLRGSGYQVLEAGDGGEALRVADGHAGAIHLLLTDVVMPGMTGWELGKLLTMRHPEVKVVYMSGYTDDAVVRVGLHDPGVVFLQKPFTLETLSRTLKEVLGGSAKA